MGFLQFMHKGGGGGKANNHLPSRPPEKEKVADYFAAVLTLPFGGRFLTPITVFDREDHRGSILSVDPQAGFVFTVESQLHGVAIRVTRRNQ